MVVDAIALPALVFIAAAAVLIAVAANRNSDPSAPTWTAAPRGKADGGRCGNCGYAVHGLPTFTCPECGSDLREVGIATARLRARGINWRPLIAFVLWSALVTTLTVTGVRLLDAFTDRTTFQESSGDLMSPVSGAYRSVKWDNTGAYHPGLTRPARLELTLRPLEGDLVIMEIDLQTGRWQTRSSSNVTRGEGSAVSLEAVLSWMASAGIDRTDPDVRAEASEVLQLAQWISLGKPLNLFRPQSFRGLGISGSSKSVPAQPWVIPARTTTIALGVIIWIVGLWRLLVRRPERRAEPTNS